MDKSLAPFQNSTIFDIPVYRLLLSPESLLRTNNPKTPPAQLIKFLPNSKNICHMQEMKYKTTEDQEKYYDSYLLMETKVFCRTLLKELGKLDENHEKTILGNDWAAINKIIGQYRLEMMKNLILLHIEMYELGTGRLKQYVTESATIDEVIKKVKAHRVLSKLTKALQKDT